MIQIRPVSDLRNKFPEIETLVNEGQPVYLTKNGYGAMVVLSLEKYASLVDNVEMKLDEADKMAETTEERASHEDVFRNVRSVCPFGSCRESQTPVSCIGIVDF